MRGRDSGSKLTIEILTGYQPRYRPNQMQTKNIKINCRWLEDWSRKLWRERWEKAGRDRTESTWIIVVI
jgi:hypothetical protein